MNSVSSNLESCEPINFCDFTVNGNQGKSDSSEVHNGPSDLSASIFKQKILPSDSQHEMNDGTKNNTDAGAAIVLASKGEWYHAAFHLSTAIAGPVIIVIPFGFAGLGWTPATLVFVFMFFVSYFCYSLLTRVMELKECEGVRVLRLRDLGEQILGRKWSLIVIAPCQIVVCLGAVIATILIGGQSMKFLYLLNNPEGTIKLWIFCTIFGALMTLLGQMPSFHSLRHANLVSVVMCIAYSICIVGACLYAGLSSSAPPKDYELVGTSTMKTFGVFNSLAILATCFGNSIMPETQATLLPPTKGKMLKALSATYALAALAFLPVGITGYWAFGNGSSPNIFGNFFPPEGPPLAPKSLIFTANTFVIIQLLAVALTYSQVSFEFLEGISDVTKGVFSARNLFPRIVLRTLYTSMATLIAAMFPFFGDVNAILGAFGFIPLDFILPPVLYLITFKPKPTSPTFLACVFIPVLFSILTVLAGIASIRQLVLDSKMFSLFANI